MDILIHHWQAILTLGIIFAVIASLALTSINPANILTAGMSALLISGILSPAQALVGFSNPGVITVGILYIVLAGLRETGAMHWISQLFFGESKSLFWIQLRLMCPSALMSAFINNTPVVAMLTAATQKWAKRAQIPSSKLLIPVSYASILGGTCTLIGTSTNLVANGLLVSQTHHSLSIFTPAWVGIPVALVGLVYLLTLGRHLLPNRLSAVEQLQNPREYTLEALIETDSPLIGKTIEQAGLRQLPNLYLIEIDRYHHLIPAPSPLERLQAGDRLIFAGVVDSVVELREIKGLKLTEEHTFDIGASKDHRFLIEVVLSYASPMIGKTVKQARFRNHYDAAIIAISRGGSRVQRKLGDIMLQPGDTLLLEGSRDFVNRQRYSKDFLLVSRLQQAPAIQHQRAPVALTILLIMIALVAFGWMNMLSASLLASVAMIITRCITSTNLLKYIDLQLLVTIASSFALGQALQQTGVAQYIAQYLLSLTGHHPWLALSCVYILTVIITELITNNAAVILMFPIALATSQHLQVNFMPFLIAIMVAASASFMTPIGYQTNLMIYGPGGYKFLDYFKVGAPLSLLVGAVAIALTPIVWPF